MKPPPPTPEQHLETIVKLTHQIQRTAAGLRRAAAQEAKADQAAKKNVERLHVVSRVLWGESPAAVAYAHGVTVACILGRVSRWCREWNQPLYAACPHSNVTDALEYLRAHRDRFGCAIKPIPPKDRVAEKLAAKLEDAKYELRKARAELDVERKAREQTEDKWFRLGERFDKAVEREVKESRDRFASRLKATRENIGRLHKKLEETSVRHLFFNLPDGTAATLASITTKLLKADPKLAHPDSPLVLELRECLSACLELRTKGKT